ncbi:MAG TPA: hypothetical protein VLW53_15955 [Candidatus Eisenbacteria bacterium]|nr:hypothetical protein [Candidatus Eisenbacteria bacterium]
MRRSSAPGRAPASPGLPTDPAGIPRILGWFAEMRERHPVHLDARTMPAWQVFRYEDVTTVLTDHARFSSGAFGDDPFLADTLIAKDPPDHRKLRNLVTTAFTPRVVAGLRGRVEEIAQELLDQVRPKGQMDVVRDFAFPLPARVIAELLGVPRDDWNVLQRWSEAEAVGGGAAQRYFSALLEDRRRAPREDLITALSTATVGGERLSER